MTDDIKQPKPQVREPDLDTPEQIAARQKFLKEANIAVEAEKLRKREERKKRKAKEAEAKAKAEAEAKERVTGGEGESTTGNSPGEKGEPLPATANPDNLVFVAAEGKFMYLPTRTLFDRATVIRQVGKVNALAIEKYKVCSNMFWSPGIGTIIANKACVEGAMYDHPNNNLLNVYKEPEYPAGDLTKADFWLELGGFVFPEGEFERLAQALAFKLQHPAKKINHAIVMGSYEQGVGKDSLLAPIETAVGANNFNSVSAGNALEWMEKGFTAPLLQKLITRVSEVHDLGSKRFTFYNGIKDWCAAPPTYITVSNKNTKAYSILNCVLPIFSTNYLLDGFHIEPGDRRTDVMWSPRVAADFKDKAHREHWNDYGYKIIRNDETKDEFWQGYYQHVAANFQHVVAYLLQPSLIEKFSPGATPFHSAAWHQIVTNSTEKEDSDLTDVFEAMGAEQKDVWDCGDDGVGMPDAVTLSQITRHPKCSDSLKTFLSNPNGRMVSRRLERGGYVAVRNSDRKDGRWNIGTTREVIYAQRGFPYRQAVEAARALVETEEAYVAAHIKIKIVVDNTKEADIG